MRKANTKLSAFLQESLAIEGILRLPSEKEISRTSEFLDLPEITIEELEALVSCHEPRARLRIKTGDNVRVGGYRPMEGGPEVRKALQELLESFNNGLWTPYQGHQLYEKLHPFTDCNGRSGRIIWAWQMLQLEQDPFSLPFLHRFYYQSLTECRP